MDRAAGGGGLISYGALKSFLGLLFKVALKSLNGLLFYVALKSLRGFVMYWKHCLDYFLMSH